MIENDKREEERLQARNKFDELVNTIKKSQKFEQLDEHYRKGILDFMTVTSNFQNGSTKYFKDKFSSLVQHFNQGLRQEVCITFMENQ